MSDQFEEQQSLNGASPSSGQEQVAPLTRGEEATQRLLLADGAAWQRGAEEYLPPRGVFTARMREQLRRESVGQALAAATAMQSAQDEDAAEKSPIDPPTNTSLGAMPPINTARSATSYLPARKGTRAMSSPTIPPEPTTVVTPHPPRRRFAGVAAGLAAVIIVALLAATLAYALHNRPRATTTTSAKHPTATTAPMATPTATPNLTGGLISPGSPYVHTTIAPSNPEVIYEVSPYGDTITRSTNGGRTFAKVTPPPTPLVNPGYFVAISPLDANHLIVTARGLPGVGTSAICRASKGHAVATWTQFSALSGDGPCGQSFYSGDGGKTWSALTLPFVGVITAPPLSILNSTTDALRAQGSRLFAFVGLSNYGGPNYLVVSSDGGASWQSASNGLGSNVCSFASAPTGETAYAITTSDSCSNFPNSAMLWRSDDGGASWTQVNTLPTANVLEMLVAPNGTLYIDLPGNDSQAGHFVYEQSADVILVSTDGGKTFSQSPQRGAPKVVDFYGACCVLSDGSIVAESTLSNESTQDFVMTFYAWRVGESSWRMVSTQINQYIPDAVVASHGNTEVIYYADTSGVIYHFTVNA